MCKIDILLATYNGAVYLSELLASLECQTHSDWRLFIRDDGSTDGTQSVIETWADRQGDRVRLLRHGVTGRGACANFDALLEVSDAPYFMLCDQDDVWLPDKMTALLGSIRQAEKKWGVEMPTIAHSDLIVVDDGLREMHRSFWRYQRLFTLSSQLRHDQLIFQNYVTGCASIGNAALRRAARPIPKEAVMHDWWLALVAAKLGKIVENQTPTMLYRQHGSNTLGAKPWSLPGVATRFVRNPAAAAQRTRYVIEKTQQQAAAFAETFADRLDHDTSELLSEYAQLGDKTFRQRKSFLYRRQLWPDNFVRAATLWWFL